MRTITIVLAVWVILSVLFGIGWARFMTGIETEADPDVCAGCDGFLEFDDDGSNICLNCGSTSMSAS